jgi:flavin reductase (DIM6/NTAB) family NADH-FMN oxidoreductase RutF
MREHFFIDAEEVLNDIQNGRAFLVARKDDRVNVMQIGWGFLGFMWNHSHMLVAVRPTRYTYELLKDADEFVVSIPHKGKMKEELRICGTKSGRDIDKINECSFKMIEGSKVSVPHIGGCKISYECKVDYKAQLDPDKLDPSINKGSYPQGDHHLILMGRIVEIHK